LADDAVGVLDAYGIPRAHLAGMSLGGMIAQIAALKHPSRVASLTLIASSVRCHPHWHSTTHVSLRDCDGNGGSATAQDCVADIPLC
jgi:pimeloyl-ACP methyl ester carboxylesterase